MILAEKITLLRKKNGWSQEELAEKIGVSRQAISKWESAQSTPDLKRVLELAGLFDVSTDVLLKDDAELAETPVFAGDDRQIAEHSAYPAQEAEPLRSISLEEASDYLKLKAAAAGRIAIGVMMCILSPIVLLFLLAAQQGQFFSIQENQAVGIGILVLMLLVGGAVGIFIYYGMKLARYEYIEKDAIETAYGVEGMVRERMERYNPTHLRYMVIGVLLCVLSCVPIFIGMIFDPGDATMLVAVCILLTMIAVGVMLIVRTNIIMEAMKSLLEEGEYSRENKQESKRNETIMGVYWLTATAIFLLISFLTKRWDISWIVWPIAGIGCGILAAVLKMIRSRE